jgi:endoglucanase
MVAAHTDEIGFLVKHIDDKGFLRLQTLGGHDPANMVSQRVVVTTADGEALKGRAPTPAQAAPHRGRRGEQGPKVDEFFVDLGMPADEVKEKVRVGDYAVMDRTLEKVGANFVGKAMDDRVGVFVMYEALRALGDHEATVYARRQARRRWAGGGGGERVGAGAHRRRGARRDARDGHTRRRRGERDKPPGQGRSAHRHGRLLHKPPQARRALPRDRRAGGHRPPDGDSALRRHRRGRVQRLHGGIPAITLSIPCRYVHTPNEMVNEGDVQAAITLLARYLEESHTGDYAL